MKTISTLVVTSSLAALTFAVGCGGGSTPDSNTAASTQASSTDAAAAPAEDPNANLPKAGNAGQPLTNPMIDDMEDGDHQIVQADGRGGYWYTYKDDTSTIEPTPSEEGGTFTMAEGGADGSKHAARFAGTIGDKQYPFAGMGFSMIEPKAAYDLSSCEGISFKAKKNTPESTGMMRFKVGDVNTVPEGGVCQDCFNDFGRDVLLTEEWTEVTAKFWEMKQEPYWGEPKPKIDASRAFQMQWQVKEAGAFDISVDDVKMIGCGGE